MSVDYPDIWDKVPSPRAILNQIMTFLRNAGYGSVQVTYPSILVLLSCLPDSVPLTGKYMTHIRW